MNLGFAAKSHLSAALAALALLSAAPSLAQETRRVIDHAGVEVDVPDQPMRIVALNDWTTTVMAYELGASLVGSGGRLDSEGKPFIRSGRELYDLDFGDIQLASIHGELDLERIAALKPDLITGLVSDMTDYREQLSLIAPTVLFHAENGHEPLDNYADFARWLNRTEEFEALQAAYDARVESFRTEVLGDQSPGSYAALLPSPRDGSIRVYRNYGSMTTVLEDVGFTRTPIMERVPEGQENALFSPEIIGEFDADYLFTTHIADRGETRELIMEQMDQITPGYRTILPAVANDRFVSMSRFHVFPTTFAAMNYVLDELTVLLD